MNDDDFLKRLAKASDNLVQIVSRVGMILFLIWIAVKILER